ncbi:MAG: helix-turn-helix domain-containing protein [Phycisphaerae bacterium]|nr:helix-turn-helix domain-containing protein [Phycisphaerae bacterium]
MARKGRKPLAAGHVEHLAGSQRAKLRLALILEAMRGAISVGEACEQLGIGESRFHALRNQWLQGALALLEPRRTGRRPREASSEELCRRLGEVEAENRELREQLAVADVRRELAEALPHVGAAAMGPPKKSAAARPRRKKKRRR